MDPRIRAQEFLKSYNLEGAKDKIIKKPQLSRDSGGYELPDYIWRSMVLKQELDSINSYNSARNNIRDKHSLLKLQQIENQRLIKEKKDEQYGEAYLNTIKQPVYRLNSNQLIGDTWLPGQAIDAQHQYQNAIINKAIELSRINRIPIANAVEQVVHDISPVKYLGNVPIGTGQTTSVATAAYHPYFKQLVESDELGYSPLEAYQEYMSLKPQDLHSTQMIVKPHNSEWEIQYDDYEPPF
jgi:hypothetical protein